MNDIEKFIEKQGFPNELFELRFISKWKKWSVYFIAYKDRRTIWGVPSLVLVNKQSMRLATVVEVERFEDYVARKDKKEKKRNKNKPHGVPDCPPESDRTLEEIEASIREEEEKCRNMTEWPEI